MDNKVEFQQRIKDIASQVGDLTTADDLFRYQIFLDIYEAPEPFLEAAAALYADPKEPALHKEISGYAMQRLPLDKLVWLVSRVADLTTQKIVAARLLEKLAFPPLNWGVQLRVDYDRAHVKALLERLARMNELNQKMRTYIREQVLTGHAKQDILELREMGQLP